MSFDAASAALAVKRNQGSVKVAATALATSLATASFPARNGSPRTSTSSDPPAAVPVTKLQTSGVLVKLMLLDGPLVAAEQRRHSRQQTQYP